MDFLISIRDYVAQGGIHLLFSAICAIVFVIVGFKLSGWIVKLISHGRGLSHLDESVRTFILSFIGVALKVLVVVVAATIIGINGTVLSAVLGSAGLAVGLAMQGSLANFAGGLMILFFRPFKVGDFVTAAGESGTVTEIGIFYTKLMTIDNKCVTIPNGAISNATVTDYSTADRRRVDLEFSVAYGSDIDKVKKVILTVVSANDKVLDDPAPFTALLRQDASALVFVVRAWCATGDYWSVYFNLMENMKKAFDSVGISIPYSQLDVHLVGKDQ